MEIITIDAKSIDREDVKQALAQQMLSDLAQAWRDAQGIGGRVVNCYRNIEMMAASISNTLFRVVVGGVCAAVTLPLVVARQIARLVYETPYLRGLMDKIAPAGRLALAKANEALSWVEITTAGALLVATLGDLALANWLQGQ